MRDYNEMSRTLFEACVARWMDNGHSEPHARMFTWGMGNMARAYKFWMEA